MKNCDKYYIEAKDQNKKPKQVGEGSSAWEIDIYAEV